MGRGECWGCETLIETGVKQTLHALYIYAYVHIYKYM